MGLDIFQQRAFRMQEMTDSINRMPYVPGRIGQMGLFVQRGITTTSIQVDERQGVIVLIPARSRGGTTSAQKPRSKRLRTLPTFHLPLDDLVMAEDVQDTRAWGSDSALESAQTVVNEKLAELNSSHEATHEYHRMGAIRGIIMDADGSTELINLFTEFGITQTTVDIALGTSTTKVRTKCTEIVRAVTNALGAAPFSSVHAFCGDEFFDALIDHDDVKAAYANSQRNIQMSSGVAYQQFFFGGVTWENYRGQVGTVGYVPTAEAIAFPTGVPDQFRHYSAPADMMGAVNRPGQRVYASQERLRHGKGVEIATQSNPLLMNHRPSASIKVTKS